MEELTEKQRLVFDYIAGRLEDNEPPAQREIAEYFGLALLVARALNGGLQRTIPPRTMLLAFLFCALYAMSDEIHQMFVPNRYADYTDVLSDVGGAAIGLVGLHFMQRMVLRRDTA